MLSKLVDSASEPLKKVLLREYLIPTGNWLLGPSGQAYLLPQFAKSSWECALSIWYLLDLFNELDQREALRKQIPEKVTHTANWIVTQAQQDSGGLRHWEGVTWDSAVCVRSILRALKKFPEKFAEGDKNNLLTISQKSIDWMILQFEDWETNVVYPYGPADVAQILITLLYIKNEWPSLVADKTTATNNVDETIEKIITYLVAVGEDLPEAFQDITTAAPFWGDFFQSGEVIAGLVEYAKECRSKKFISHDPKLATDCERQIIQHVQYLENHQVDGKWGPHADTCRALFGYMQASQIIGRVGKQEDHIVFKSLRWMCDEKQTFTDGSFMHTTFITVFYAAALWEVYNTWSLATQSVIQVYDSALWAAPVRSTPERSLRLELQLENQRILDEKNNVETQLKQIYRKLGSAGGMLFTLLVAFAVAIISGVIKFRAPFSVVDQNIFIQYVAVVVPIVIVVGTALYRRDYKKRSA